jgi:sec-independent protein translocase protein TatB
LLLLIGETVGWQELIFIGILALIFLGPRKLPTMAKTIGKYMAEFRRAANEFKSTWESEVSSISKEMKDELKDTDNDMRLLAFLENPKPIENSVSRSNGVKPAATEETNGHTNGATQLEAPTVKQIESSSFEQNTDLTVPAETVKESKKDWL